jgi:hypothetical protein
MNTYNFINNGGSVTVVENGKPITFGENMVSVEPFGALYLKVTSTSGALKVFTFSIIDDISINGVLFNGTLDQLNDALILIFFSGESGGGDVSVHHGFFDYNDTSTIAAPITLLADTWTDVPNDGLGAFTNLDYVPTGMTKLIDTSNGSLDFTELTLGSDVLIRVDFNVTPQTNNALLESRYVLGTGAGLYSLPIVSRRLDSGAGIPYSSEKGSFYIYMGDTNTLDNPAALQVKLSTGGTLVNNGLAIKVYKK